MHNFALVSNSAFPILEADLLQVAEVMGLEHVIDVPDDIGMADAVLASSSEMKRNPWISGVAKFHRVPIFVMKVKGSPVYEASRIRRVRGRAAP